MVPDPAQGYSLEGKVALVTGAIRGLGRQIVLAFAAAGADGAIVSRKLEQCKRVATEVRDRIGRRALALPCHVGDWDRSTGSPRHGAGGSG